MRPIYEDPQTYETNNETTEVMDNEEELTSVEDMDELKDILVPDEIKHVVPSVPRKSQQVFQRPDLMQLPGPKMGNSIGGMTQLDMEKSDTISTPYITQEVFVDPFPKNLEILFLEEDAVSAIEDKDTMKQKSAMIEDTKWPVLVDLGSRAEVSEHK